MVIAFQSCHFRFGWPRAQLMFIKNVRCFRNTSHRLWRLAHERDRYTIVTRGKRKNLIKADMGGKSGLYGSMLKVIDDPSTCGSYLAQMESNAPSSPSKCDICSRPLRGLGLLSRRTYASLSLHQRCSSGLVW